MRHLEGLELYAPSDADVVMAALAHPKLIHLTLEDNLWMTLDMLTDSNIVMSRLRELKLSHIETTAEILGSLACLACQISRPLNSRSAHFETVTC